MEYKVLLAEQNNNVIEDFLNQMGEKFEVMSTSACYEDIMKHIKYFKPDIFICSVCNDSKNDFGQFQNVKSQLSRFHIPFVLFGEVADCGLFEKSASNVSDLTIHKPVSVPSLGLQLAEFMENWNKNDAEAENEDSENAGFTGEEIKSGSGRKHILIIDDSPIMLKTLTEQLRSKYDVATAISGKVALRFLERKNTDLILLDYDMPEENGPVVLEKLRANEFVKDVPVIFLTGVTDAIKIKTALAMKPQAYLLKPIDHGKLIAAITKVIGV